MASREIDEQIANIIHEQWIHWTKYMLDNLTDENIARWRRQIDTPYSELSEKEKDSDRNLVPPYKAIVASEVEKARIDEVNGFQEAMFKEQDPYRYSRRRLKQLSKPKGANNG